MASSSTAGVAAGLFIGLVLSGDLEPSHATSNPENGPSCSMATLPGLSGQYARAIRQARDLPAAAQAADFWQVAESILGPSVRSNPDLSDETPIEEIGWPSRTDLPCDSDVRSRDHVAWQMALVGYSAKEIGDVLEGHLTLADLDRARARLRAGQPGERVADYLEARWREATPETRRVTVEVVRSPVPETFVALDGELLALAQQNRVPAELVRAMVAAGSDGNTHGRSRPGAVGLMQLMPSTAASLGVDPWEQPENLRGGVAYLASLLRAYDEDTRLALIAYIAGPQHADRVRAGSAVAYHETREYLDAIEPLYPLP